MRRFTSLLLAVAIAGCNDVATTSPDASRTLAVPTSIQRDVSSSSSVWARQITGETKPGALYAFFVPNNWNGDVVYYAHGIVDAALPVALPTGDGFPELRDALGSLGYAVAYSSFSENGWAVKDGAQTTHQLRGIFASAVGKPRRSFLVGTSLGGLVAQNLSEKHGKEYDGVLAMCAPLGGTAEEVTYIGNVRVLFDLMYPGVLPGDVITVPPGFGDDLNRDVYGPVLGAIGANPTGLGIIARLRQTPLAGNNGSELATSLLYALAYDVRGTNDFLDRTHGHSMFDNSSTAYAAAAPGLLPDAVLAGINQGVGRFTATPDALNYLDRYYLPSGDIGIPTVTMHTMRDPLVPFFHEAEFAANVAKQGDAGKLLQRSYDAFGHCAFSTAQMVDAFQGMEGWVRTGQKPAN
jgi:pimeloyl-ACP methyl ester carboxylesterase